jgi:hypothetical protein
MNMQTCLTLALVLLAGLYFLRNGLKSALGKGCASGCGSCDAGGCPAKKLQKHLDALPPRES